MIQYIIKHKFVAFLLPIIVVFALTYGAKSLKISNDYHMFFADDNPQLLAFDNLQDTYNKTDNILIALRDTQNSIFTQQNLKAIADISKQAWQTPYSSRVDSLANYQYTFAAGDDLIVSDLVDTEFEFDEKKIANIAINEVLLKNRLITDKKDTTAINITLELPRNEDEATAGQAQAVQFVRELRDKIKTKYPQFEIMLSGLIMLNNSFPEAAMGDMQTLVPLSFALVFVLMMVLLRSIVVVSGAILLIIFTIIGSLGFAGHIGYPITPPMSSIPVIILTITVAGSVHLMMSFIKHLRLGENKINALINAFNHNIKAIIIAAITTAIGFFGLNFSEVPPFHDLGNTAAIGTLLALFLVAIWLPAWILILPTKTKSIKTTTKLVDFLAEFVIKQQNKILVIFSLIAIGFISLVPLNEIDDNFVEYFDERVEFRRDADKVDKYLTGIGSIDYSFESGEDNGIANPEFLAAVDKFVSWVRTLPEVNNVSTLTDILKRLNKNMHGDDESFYKLPNNRELSAQYLLLYEMSLPYGLDLNNQINTAKSAIRVSVNMQNTSSQGYLALSNKIDKWLKANTPSIHTEGASPSIMFAHIGKRNVSAMIIGTTLTLVLISILLMLILRSVKIGVVSLMPNLVPLAIAFGLWAVVDGTITMALAVVGSITLGIIVDDTVHFLTKFNFAIKNLGKNVADSVRYAFHHVGNALIVSTIALTSGFMVLINSVFKINAGMGEITSYIIVIALVMDLLLLPTILLKVYKK
jgi:predicted RND superfamily exporter protein